MLAVTNTSRGPAIGAVETGTVHPLIYFKNWVELCDFGEFIIRSSIKGLMDLPKRESTLAIVEEMFDGFGREPKDENDGSSVEDSGQEWKVDPTQA